MEMVTLGAAGPSVSRVGLGLMGMSGIYGEADEDESLATIQAAVDAGINLLDTGDFYGMGHNELLLRSALRSIPRDQVFIQVKFGGQRDPAGRFIGHDASPVAVKNSLAYTLTRLGTDYVDLYQPARLDPRVPIEETVGAIAEMVEAGYVRYIGLSEVGSETIERAVAASPLVTALQIEYSLMSRSIERSVLPTVRSLGLGVTAYGILSRGLLSTETSSLAPGDPRARFPRFQGSNHEQNLALVAALATVAAAHDATVAQLAIAWVLSRGADIIPLLGTKRRSRLSEALGALDLTLSDADLAAIEAAVPASAVAGDRYDAPQMAALDSERGL
jgi:aryl-alcohol dehydrogenase-like predicted oxidoreductase